MNLDGFLSCLFVTVVLNYTPVRAEKISSKLDFGLDSSDKIEIKTDSQILEARNLPTRSPGDDGKHVVCSENGCNTTQVQTKTNGILTDVVVHVQTSGGGSSTVVSNDTVPDVPVIVGYGGTSSSDVNSDDIPISKSLIVTNIEEVYPDLNRRVSQGNNDFYSTSNPNYGGTSQTFVTVPGDRVSVIPNGYGNKQVSNDNDFLYVPYSDSSHNFGESPPPQAVWYPKNSVSFNPLEFKRFNTRPVWNKQPPTDYRSYVTTGPTASGGYTTCMCQNPGLTWYPTMPTWRVGNQKAGFTRPLTRASENEAHIDDKLGSFD